MSKSQGQSSLQAVLERQAAQTPPPEAAPRKRSRAVTKPAAPEPAKFYRPSREGKRLIAGHFAPEKAKQLKIIAAEEDTSVQALLDEALDLLFVKKGRGKVRV
jgi:hypothetical protein